MPSDQLIRDADSDWSTLLAGQLFHHAGYPPPPPGVMLLSLFFTATINSNLILPRSRAKLGICAEPFLYLVSHLFVSSRQINSTISLTKTYLHAALHTVHDFMQKSALHFFDKVYTVEQRLPCKPLL
jgi:hypothetical protein